MSATYLSQRTTGSRALTTYAQPFAPTSTPTTPAQAWTRPADWIAMPSLTPNVDKKIHIIAAVFNSGSNIMSFSCWGTGTGITVDWGDGLGAVNYNYTSGTVNTNYNISWSNISSSTVTSQGYRQALITITAQAGSTITRMGLTSSSSSAGNWQTSNFTDVAVCNSDIVCFTASGLSGANGTSTTTPNTNWSLLERVNLVQVGTLDLAQYMFYNCTSLRNVSSPLTFASNMTSVQSMFDGCTSLQTAPTVVATGCATMVNMFAGCTSLLDCGSFDSLGSANVTQIDIGQMFLNCHSLETIPAFPYNARYNYSYSSTFDGCYSLRNIPIIDMTGFTGAFGTSTFRNCYNLRTIRLVGTLPNTVNANSMFQNCYSLVNLTLPSGLERISANSNMFNNCQSLETLPDLDFSGVNSSGAVFSGCVNLRSVGRIRVGSTLATTNNWFLNCYNLRYFGGLVGNLTGITNLSGMFQNCFSLTSVPDITVVTFTTAANMFSGCAALETAPNIIMSAGTNALTTTASMFAACYSLTTVPDYNSWTWSTTGTSAASMFLDCRRLKAAPNIGSNSSRIITRTSMFQNCYALTSVPAYDLTSCTTTQLMFSTCSSLQQAPAFTNTSAVTTVASMFVNCRSLIEIPAYNLNGVSSSAGFTNWVNIGANGSNLTRVQVSNTRFTISYANNRLAGAQLDEIYTNLPTITAQTITVTGNWGTATDTPSIATGKGWTVTGS